MGKHSTWRSPVNVLFAEGTYRTVACMLVATVLGNHQSSYVIIIAYCVKEKIV